MSLSVVTVTSSFLPSTKFGAVPQIFSVFTVESNFRGRPGLALDLAMKSRPAVAERVWVA